MLNNPLAGITRRGSCPFENPTEHSPAGIQNIITLECVGPDGELKKRVVHKGNILTTFGLNRLVEMIATDVTNNYGAPTGGWIRSMAVGTDNTALVSTDLVLGASTQSVDLNAASMTKADAGNRTLGYRGTIDGALAYTINEVGLFATNSSSASGVALSALAASDAVIKGTADTVHISYDLVMTTV